MIIDKKNNEPLAGFEPATLSLRMKCATSYAKVALLFVKLIRSGMEV